jgi:hypothetical protein
MRVAELHPAAHALSMFRALPDGNGRAYTAVTFPADPRGGCLQIIRMAAFVGWIVDSSTDTHGYGVLDVLDAEGDIIQDYAVVDADGFQRIKRKLDLRVASQDGDERPVQEACDLRADTSGNVWGLHFIDAEGVHVRGSNGTRVLSSEHWEMLSVVDVERHHLFPYAQGVDVDFNA